MTSAEDGEARPGVEEEAVQALGRSRAAAHSVLRRRHPAWPWPPRGRPGPHRREGPAAARDCPGDFWPLRRRAEALGKSSAAAGSPSRRCRAQKRCASAGSSFCQRSRADSTEAGKGTTGGRWRRRGEDSSLLRSAEPLSLGRHHLHHGNAERPGEPRRVDADARVPGLVHEVQGQHQRAAPSWRAPASEGACAEGSWRPPRGRWPHHPTEGCPGRRAPRP